MNFKKIMNKLILPFVLFILCSQVSAQSVEQLTSPDGNLRFSFELNTDGVPTYSVTYQQTAVVLSSVLGLSGWEKGFIVADVARTKKDTTWKPVYGERSVVKDHYEEM